MSDIKIYNTLSRTIEDFIPIKKGVTGIYSCGPTVYHYAHIGNLRAYIYADILRRTLVYDGLEVKHLINITDVGHLTDDGNDGEDKLEKGAIREGKTAYEVAEFYTKAFLDDLEKLNIPQKEYIFPRATDHINEQIEIIKELEEKGYTYKINDGIYFDTSKFKSYGKMAKLDIEGLKSGARVTENKEKRNITDFALWKFSKADEKRQMEWNSPWGKGFPGWHIECSAMSIKYLGKHFDIHTGGIDHIPVHHTNEIAQSESATGEKFVNYWMHINFLNEKDGKMSKSTGDFLRLQTLIDKKINPLSFRYYILTTHYRKEVNFSFESLNAADEAYKKLLNFCIGKNNNLPAGRHDGNVSVKYKKDFNDVIFYDLNTAEAIAVIWKMLKDDQIKDEDKYSTLMEMDSVLGLDLANAKKEEIVLTEKIKELIHKREVARNEKNWALSDEIRNEIRNLGFDVKDTENGQEIVLNGNL